MAGKFIMEMRSEDRKRDLPRKLIIGQRENESARHVILKLLGYSLFFRERLEIEGQVYNDSIPYEPDLVQVDYTLRPVLWIECGECSVQKLHKLAVKVPDAEIWVLKASVQDATHLVQAMTKGELRKNRYRLIGFEPEMIQEMCSLLQYRNEWVWVTGEWDPPQLQFSFNDLWFDHPFTVLHH